MKLGVIACSSIAKRRFLPAVQRISNLSIWHIGSRDIEKAEKFSSIFQSPKYGTYEDVLQDSEVDIVYISTPPHNHFELASKALNYGKHVICEKPITNHISDLERLNKIATEKKVLFAEHYSFLYHNQHSIVKNLINNGAIGDVCKIVSSYLYPKPNADDIRLKADILGGVSHDSLGYPILAGLYFLNTNPYSITSTLSINTILDIDECCSFNIKFEDAELYGEVGMGKEYNSSYEVHGSIGAIKIHRAFSVDPEYDAKITLIKNNSIQELIATRTDQIKEFIEVFLENIDINLKSFQYHNKFYNESSRLRIIQDEVIKNAKINFV